MLFGRHACACVVGLATLLGASSQPILPTGSAPDLPTGSAPDGDYEFNAVANVKAYPGGGASVAEGDLFLAKTHAKGVKASGSLVLNGGELQVEVSVNVGTSCLAPGASYPNLSNIFPTGTGADTAIIGLESDEYKFEELLGHAVIVRAVGTPPGSPPIGCGLLKAPLQATAQAWIDQYPGLDYSHQSITGRFRMTKLGDTTVSFSGVVDALPGPAGSGGWHVHTGLTCDDASLVGGHYYPGLSVDPWSTVTYYSENGASTVVNQVIQGFTFEELLGHSLVLHQVGTGTRIGCGVLIDPYTLKTAQHIVTDGQPLAEPLEYIYQDDGDLELVMGQLELIFPAYNVSTYTRAYNGMLPGPTIRIKAGQTFRVMLFNGLGEDPNGYDPAGSSLQPEVGNKPNSPNNTNLHVHGLHVTSNAPGDDVMNVHLGPVVTPLHSYQYSYAIPQNHMSGTFWYHSHNHGSTGLQSGGGGAGLLIMDDPPNSLPQEYANAPEIKLAVFGVEFPKLIALEIESQGNLWKNAESLPDMVMVVNGHTNPIISIEAGVWYRWRVLYSAIFNKATLDLSDEDRLTSGCEFNLIAKDGIYLMHAPRVIPRIPLWEGSRADVMVRCQTVGTYEITSDGTYDPTQTSNYFQGKWASLKVTPPSGGLSIGGELGFGWNGGKGGRRSGAYFPPVPSPLPGFVVDRPCYLVDLQCKQGDVDAKFNVVFSIATVNGTPSFRINDKEYDVHTPMVGAEALPVGALLEIDLNNTQFHPFHMHVYPFQIQEMVTTAYPEYIQVGDWQDVLYGPTSSKVYFSTPEFTGDIIMHCHLLEHEDRGMMTYIKIVGEEGKVWQPAQSIDPKCTPYSSNAARKFYLTDTPLTCAQWRSGYRPDSTPPTPLPTTAAPTPSSGGADWCFWFGNCNPTPSPPTPSPPTNAPPTNVSPTPSGDWNWSCSFFGLGC
jgi:FtsP/CotA-like multicopper oxidase with cupredoxin domain